RERARAVRTPAAAIELADTDMPLFETLRELRARLAREQGVPAYVIFHDSTLREIAASRPASETELAGVGGIGAGKLERYGEEVLETVRLHGQGDPVA
ncbi:MAG: HRDC domain-containing protein, partial [Luteimonas sp.]